MDMRTGCNSFCGMAHAFAIFNDAITFGNISRRYFVTTGDSLNCTYFATVLRNFLTSIDIC
mgnify:CR=1 FL=1